MLGACRRVGNLLDGVLNSGFLCQLLRRFSRQLVKQLESQLGRNLNRSASYCWDGAYDLLIFLQA